MDSHRVHIDLQRLQLLATARPPSAAQAHRMGYPRAVIVDPDQPGFFHCMSRCVRRAFLCGTDDMSGRCFDHRRDWIERRLLRLADSFAVGLYAWAVMSNHTHVVLHIDPRLPKQWSDEDVARRWARLDRMLAEVPERQIEERVRRILEQPERLAELRGRLGSLSWFMRFLNECIAREANAEDRCTGRFWEGRFRSQALLDDAAVTACMAYVDLNPIRAGVADELVDSDFTTIQRRLRALASNPDAGGAPLKAMAGIDRPALPGMSLNAYIDLVDCTGRLTRPDKRGAISASAARGAPWTPSWISEPNQTLGEARRVGVHDPCERLEFAPFGRRTVPTLRAATAAQPMRYAPLIHRDSSGG